MGTAVYKGIECKIIYDNKNGNIQTIMDITYKVVTMKRELIRNNSQKQRNSIVIEMALQQFV